MSEQEKKALVPALRFPEFRDEVEWGIKSLGESCDILNNLRKPITGSNREKGLYPYYGASGIVDYVKDYIFDEQLLLIGEDGAKWGAFEKTAFIVEGKYWVNNHAHVLRTKTLNDVFLENYIVMLDVAPFITGAAPPKLTLQSLKSIPVPAPQNIDEQQKIADCLSSLDELISLQTQKRDALKAHKKGLMQKLFPATGETQPKLRFPEFRGKGEWKAINLGEVTEFSSGGTPSKETSAYWGGEIPWISAVSMHQTSIRYSDNNITKLAVLEGARTVPKGTLLLLVRGSMLHKRIPVGITEVEVAFNQDVKALILRVNIFERFLLYLLVAVEWRLLNSVTKTGIGAGKLDTADLKDFLVCYPTEQKEQQKIADCLSYLDVLITAQSQKIDALKAHKKGLMQQLFPSMDAGGRAMHGAVAEDTKAEVDL